MKIKHPLLVRAIGVTGAGLVRQLGRTLHYHFRYQDPSVAPEVARQTGAVPQTVLETLLTTRGPVAAA